MNGGEGDSERMDFRDLNNVFLDNSAALCKKATHYNLMPIFVPFRTVGGVRERFLKVAKF